MTAPPPVRIIVADNQQVVRSGFAGLLDTQADFTVVGTAFDGAEAVWICRELRPDIVLTDVRMPSMDGIEATRQLAGPRAGGPRIFILTTFDLEEYVYDALLAPAVTRRLIGEFALLHPRPDAPPTTALAALTRRETKVLRLVAEGLSNSEIAARLVVTRGDSEDVREPHAAQAGTPRPDTAVVTAYESGLVVPRKTR